MARVLVIEDEPDLREVLSYNLGQSGHQPLLAGTGKEGLRLAVEHRPGLIVLDLMLPDMHGTDVCRSLKGLAETRDIPVLIATARGEEIDRVVGFELGADDYIVKPFSVRELLLRIQAILRRGRAEPLQDGRENASTASIEFGCLRIDRSAHRVWVNAKEVELTSLEFSLLVTLHENRSRVLTRAALLNDVWGIRADYTTRTVDTHVKRLREKLESARDYVETVRGVGYRFASAPSPAAPLGGPCNRN